MSGRTGAAGVNVRTKGQPDAAAALTNKELRVLRNRLRPARKRQRLARQAQQRRAG